MPTYIIDFRGERFYREKDTEDEARLSVAKEVWIDDVTNNPHQGIASLETYIDTLKFIQVKQL